MSTTATTRTARPAATRTALFAQYTRIKNAVAFGTAGAVDCGAWFQFCQAEAARGSVAAQAECATFRPEILAKLVG